PTSRSGLPSPFQSTTAGLLRMPQRLGLSNLAASLNSPPASGTSGRGASNFGSLPSPMLRYQVTLPEPEPSTRSSFPSPSQSARHGPASPPSAVTAVPLAISLVAAPKIGCRESPSFRTRNTAPSMFPITRSRSPSPSQSATATADAVPTLMNRPFLSL